MEKRVLTIFSLIFVLAIAGQRIERNWSNKASVDGI